MLEHPTDRHRDGIVRQLIKRPRLFHKLIENATQHVADRKRRNRTLPSRSSGVPTVFIPSSPPPEGLDDDLREDLEDRNAMDVDGVVETHRDLSASEEMDDDAVVEGEGVVDWAGGRGRRAETEAHGADDGVNGHGFGHGYFEDIEDMYADDPDGLHARSDPDYGAYILTGTYSRASSYCLIDDCIPILGVDGDADRPLDGEYTLYLLALTSPLSSMLTTAFVMFKPLDRTPKEILSWRKTVSTRPLGQREKMLSI